MHFSVNECVVNRRVVHAYLPSYLCDYWFDRGMNSLAYLVASSIVPVCFDAG